MLSVNVLGSEKADATAGVVKPGRLPRGLEVFTDLQGCRGEEAFWVVVPKLTLRLGVDSYFRESQSSVYG